MGLKAAVCVVLFASIGRGHAGEVSYETYGRASGVRSHKWDVALSEKGGMKAGMYLVKDESPAAGFEAHMLGVYGSRGFKRAGFRAGYALKDRTLSGAAGKSLFSGGLRVTPLRDLDVLVDYDRVGEEFVSGEEDLEKETLSCGLRLKAFDSFKMSLAYAGRNLLRVRVSCGW